MGCGCLRTLLAFVAAVHTCDRVYRTSLVGWLDVLVVSVDASSLVPFVLDSEIHFVAGDRHVQGSVTDRPFRIDLAFPCKDRLTVAEPSLVLPCLHTGRASSLHCCHTEVSFPSGLRHGTAECHTLGLDGPWEKRTCFEVSCWVMQTLVSHYAYVGRQSVVGSAGLRDDHVVVYHFDACVDHLSSAAFGRGKE